MLSPKKEGGARIHSIAASNKALWMFKRNTVVYELKKRSLGHGDTLSKTNIETRGYGFESIMF